jgi:hypothetical protein
MNENYVRELEKHLEKPIADGIRTMGLHELPLLLSPRTVHLMAKAAVSVYAAAGANSQSEPRAAE